MVQSPPGSGKTRTSTAVIFDALSRGRRVLFLAHRKELVTQPRDAFAEFDMQSGIIKAGFEFQPDLPLQIASVQTLVNRLSDIQEPDLIVVDEAHHSVAGTWNTILSAFPNAKILGLSGTPERADGLGLEDTFEAMIQGPKIPWLIERGFLVDSDVFGAPDRLKLPKPQGADYDPGKILRALEHRGRDGDPLAYFQQQHSAGMRGVGFGHSVEWCEFQAQRFQAAGYRAFCLSGETKDEVRDEILKGYKSGDTDFVWNVDVIGEGTDIPDLEILVDCAKTTSLVRYLQRAGRIQRPADDKGNGIYIDLVGNVGEHGHPSIARDWSLQGEAGRNRASEVTEDGEHLSTRQCKSCHQHYVSAPECPYCGSDHGPEKRVSKERAVKIRKLEKQEIEASRKEKARLRREEEKACKSLQELQALGARRGNKPGWAYKLWSGRKKTAEKHRKKENPNQMRFGLDGWPV